MLRDPGVLQGAIQFLTGCQTREREVLQVARDGSASRPHFADWSLSSIRPVYEASLRYARSAQRLAEVVGRCDPDLAWVAGLLAPLGWLAVCAADAEQAAACLVDPELPQCPASTQRLYWSYDQAEIARRLVRRWRLPSAIAVIVGHLGLPLEIAQALGADPFLFRIVQMAVGLVEEQGRGLYLTLGAKVADNAAALAVSARDRERLTSELADSGEPCRGLESWIAPQSIPLLGDLLNLAVENQRLHEAPALEQLERERDQLHQALETQRTSQTEQLQALKLKALAEFAAGAAHEINNPLAVISGQAQYLLGREAEPDRQRALQTIIGQAQRIHQVLSELMQFARPPRPQKQPLDVRSLVREVTLSLMDLAAGRQVQLLCPEPDQSIELYADSRQIRTALECLVRNAIEAAPAGGWVSIRASILPENRLELLVEDNGRGPAPAQREHLFDPFYSGHPAGRGRGLGLPTAWRLAREHGGDVRLDDTAGGPTRFILSLPREGESGNVVLRPSA
jgi:signal transduction histidine kinase